MIAMELGAMGPNYGIVSACATGTHALGEALKFIQQGYTSSTAATPQLWRGSTAGACAALYYYV